MPKMSKEEFTREFRRTVLGREGAVDLPNEILKYRCDFLMTANELTDFKLTVAELNQTFVFLAGLLLGKYPQIVFTVKSSDRIRLPYAALEQLPSTQGKLTENEKLLLSFAVFHAVCTEFYDEKTNKIHKGILEIDSLEHTESLLSWDIESHPERYEFLSGNSSSSSASFGTSIDNPIKAVSVSDSYKYLKRLRTKKGRPVKYHRVGSTFDSRDNIIDIYTLSLLDETMTIYINPYSLKNSEEAPEGLILEPEADDEYIEELKLRAESGDGKADFELGLKYYNGEGGLKQDYKEAFKCYMRSAEQGYDVAMCNLGLMYSRGYGVRQSYSEAAKWYAMAAEVDFPEALHNLGVLYCEGRGVPRDMDKAVELWYRAASKGFELSQLNLGIMYLSEDNREEAVKWLKKAADKGNEEAMSILAGLK